MVAEYDTEINVPVSRSLVMTAGREVIQQAYLEAGRPASVWTLSMSMMPRDLRQPPIHAGDHVLRGV